MEAVNKLPDYFIPSVTLTIDELRTLAGNPNAVFGYRPGFTKIYFVRVPSISALHALACRETGYEH